jgi:hypothetical protein
MRGLRLIRAAAFDPEATRVMGLAYERACANIDANDVAARELIAKRIIEAARRGECDVARLAEHAATGLQNIPGIADAG